MDHVLHAGQRGGGDVVRDTVPLKLLRLVSVIVDAAEEPAVMVRLDGVAVIAKSGPTTLIGSHGLSTALLLASPL